MTIKTFVVLSAPSTCSSLIAECLHQNGIHMGNELGDNGHFENQVMLQLSRDILAYAREIDEEGPLFEDYEPRHETDPWDNPPSEQAILQCRQRFEQRIINTIQAQQRHATFCEPQPHPRNAQGNPAHIWGWKDGRIGWIIPIIAPYLTNPHYIVLHRGYEQTAQAIDKRLQESGVDYGVERAMILVKTMYRRIFDFMATL